MNLPFPRSKTICYGTLKLVGRLLKPAASHTRSVQSSRIIKTWIEKCLKDHQACIALQRARNTDQHLPYRLLYIGQEKNPPRVKLCYTARLSRATKYATLSHVWGTSLHLKLTCENQEDFLRGITVANLPRTFRHAVEVTSSLSLEYLWIDALCIVQDSVADWERECSTMASIYSGGYINIAANAAVHSDGGLFTLRRPLEISPCMMYVSNILRHWQKEPCAVWVEDPNRRYIADSPLNKRAWVLQERLLSPRTVHFTGTKIFWECPTHIASEIDPQGYFEVHQESGLTQGWSMPSSWHEVSVESQRADCLEKWKNAVNLYSSGNLTYESDKLVAIAGIARYMHSFWPDPTTRYLAGLWSHNLVFSLAWRRSSLAPFPSRPERYRAPTWSWAAVNGEIEFCGDLYVSKDRSLASIIEEQTYPTGDPFGAVEGGYISIKGPICAAIAKGPHKEAGDVLYLESTKTDIVVNSLWLDHGSYEVHGSDDLDRFYLLGLISRSLIEPFSQIKGLVLLPSKDQRGQYSRIGLFDVMFKQHNISTPFDSSDYVDRLCRAFEEFSPAETLYLESHDDHTFTIEII